MARLKLFLWQIGFYPNRCPYCGEKLMEQGYAKEFFQNYLCTDDKCKFNMST